MTSVLSHYCWVFRVLVSVLQVIKQTLLGGYCHRSQSYCPASQDVAQVARQ